MCTGCVGARKDLGDRVCGGGLRGQRHAQDGCDGQELRQEPARDRVFVGAAQRFLMGHTGDGAF